VRGPITGPAPDEESGAWPPPTTEQLDSRERRLSRAVLIIPYCSLAVATALACAVRLPNGAPLAVMLPLAAGALAWLLLQTWLDRRPRFRSAPVATWWSAAYFFGLLAFLTLLNLCSPLFGFFGISCYISAVRDLPKRLHFTGLVLTALPVALSQTGGQIPDSAAAGFAFLGVLLFNLLVARLMTALATVIADQARHHRRSAAELAEANEKLARMLEENAGLHSQLLMQAREAGATDERQRLAREIHDTVAQGLAGIVTQLQAAEHGTAPAERARHLDNAARLARESLNEARRAVSALRPIQLADAELPEALEEVVGTWRELHGIRAELTVTGSPRPLHPEVEVTLLRAAQESLSNAGKHARATRVGLTLSYMPDLVTLDVRDDGKGFDPALAPDRPAAHDGGYGLTAMRQRVERLSGRLEIESEPGGGTAVSAAVPAIPREEQHG
jgi:signal transduction histidine kinase